MASIAISCHARLRLVNRPCLILRIVSLRTADRDDESLRLQDKSANLLSKRCVFGFLVCSSEVCDDDFSVVHPLFVSVSDGVFESRATWPFHQNLCCRGAVIHSFLTD